MERLVEAMHMQTKAESYHAPVPREYLGSGAKVYIVDSASFDGRKIISIRLSSQDVVDFWTFRDAVEEADDE